MEEIKPKMDAMEKAIQPNQRRTRIGRISSRFDVSPGSVGSDIDAMSHRLNHPPRSTLFGARTDRETYQAFNDLWPHINAGGTVVMGAYENTDGTIGTLTVGTTRSKAVSVNLNSLRKTERRRTDKELAEETLDQVFDWLNDENLNVIILDRDSWRNFMRSCGRTMPKRSGIYDTIGMVNQGLRHGLIDHGFRPPQTGVEAKAILAHVYAGQSFDAVLPEVYGTAFPGSNYPGHRDRSQLYNWPYMYSFSEKYLDWFQHRLLKNDYLGAASLAMDLVRHGIRFEEARAVSPLTPCVFRGVLDLEMGATSVPELYDTPNDVTLLTLYEDDLNKWVDMVRQANMGYFGPSFCERKIGENYPGDNFREWLTMGVCEHCGEKHEAGEECWIKRQIRNGRLNRQARNCLYCWSSNHLVRVCFMMHFRCKNCGLLGHLTVLCGRQNFTSLFLKFCMNCRSGRFTGIEVRGPVLGPLGFGQHQSLRISFGIRMMIKEVSGELRFAHARLSENEQNALARFVSRVLEDVPFGNLTTIQPKDPDQNWTQYLADYDKIRRIYKRYAFHRVGNGIGDREPIMRNGNIFVLDDEVSETSIEEEEQIMADIVIPEIDNQENEEGQRGRNEPPAALVNEQSPREERDEAREPRRDGRGRGRQMLGV